MVLRSPSPYRFYQYLLVPGGLTPSLQSQEGLEYLES